MPLKSPTKSPTLVQVEQRAALSNDPETLEASINKFREELRPKILQFFTEPRLPTWLPPKGGADEATQRWYEGLGIPLVNNKPNLLLHQLGDIRNPNVDGIFKGEHR